MVELSDLEGFSAGVSELLPLSASLAPEVLLEPSALELSDDLLTSFDRLSFL